MPEEIVQILKKYGGAFDFNAREWIVGINKYKEVAQEISNFCRVKLIDLDPITQMAFDVLEYTVPFSDETKKNIIYYDYQQDIMYRPMLSLLPPSLYHSLYNFQKVGVQYGVDHFGRIILGDEMGVGKTIQAISIAYLFQRDWPILIITPSSLKYSWRDELLTWVEHLRTDQIQVFAKSTEEFDHSACIYIMSYVLATKLSAFIDRKKFHFCIADEAHYLKSRDSQRSKYLVPVLMKIKRVLLLSGTPILARPNEIYNLLRILRPDIFYTFKEFGLRYCSPRESYFGVDWTGSSNMRELHLMLEKGLMIRRLKSEVLLELPAKRRQRIIVPCDQHCIKKISVMLKKVKNWDENYSDKGAAAGQGPGEGSRKKDSNGNLIESVDKDFDHLAESTDLLNDADLEAMDDKYSHLLSAYQMTGSAKVKGTVEFVENLVENKVKFIVFCHHYEVMDQIEDAIVKKKIPYIRIDGQIEATKRYEAVKKFQTDPSILVGILSLTASSQGITLTAATTVVFAEMNWTPGIMVQAEDRCHRIGQANSVNVYYLFGENTVDAMIYPRLKLKSEVFANVLDGSKTEFTIENEDDMEKLGEKGMEQNEEMQKVYQKEQKMIEKAISSEDATKFQQTTVKDFFFQSAIGNKSSKIKGESAKPGKKPQEGVSDEVVVDDKDNLVINDGEQNFEAQYNFEEYFPEEMVFDKPPNPPLATINPDLLKDAQILDVEAEVWGEGADSKWRAYQQLRSERKRYYAEQKELRAHKKKLRRRGVDMRDNEHDDQDINWKEDYKVLSQDPDNDYVKNEKEYKMKNQEKEERERAKQLEKGDDQEDHIDKIKQDDDHDRDETLDENGNLVNAEIKDENDIDESQATRRLHAKIREKEKYSKGMNLTFERAGGFRCSTYGAKLPSNTPGKQDPNYYTEKYRYNQQNKPDFNQEGFTPEQQQNYLRNGILGSYGYQKYNNFNNGSGFNNYNREKRQAWEARNNNQSNGGQYGNRQPGGFEKHAKWQGDRYKEKISKYYDKRKAAAYDEYVEFKKELAVVEQTFLKRLPQSDPSVMKFKVRKLEAEYQSGELSHTREATRSRHDIIEEIYGFRPAQRFTHYPLRPQNFIESNIVYLEGEKFVQDWEIPTLDPSKGKIKGVERGMLEDCRGPYNTCVGSDEENFDADQENKSAQTKFEEMGMKDYMVKQEEIDKKAQDTERILKDRERIKKLIEQEERGQRGENSEEETPSQILLKKTEPENYVPDISTQKKISSQESTAFQIPQADLSSQKQRTIKYHKEPVSDSWPTNLMDDFDLDNMMVTAIKEEEYKRFQEQEKFYQAYDERMLESSKGYYNKWNKKDEPKDNPDQQQKDQQKKFKELYSDKSHILNPYDFFEKKAERMQEQNDSGISQSMLNGAMSQTNSYGGNQQSSNTNLEDQSNRVQYRKVELYKKDKEKPSFPEDKALKNFKFSFQNKQKYDKARWEKKQATETSILSKLVTGDMDADISDVSQSSSYSKQDSLLHAKIKAKYNKYLRNEKTMSQSSQQSNRQFSQC